MIEANLRQLPDRIRAEDRVLDVGGWHAPLNRANFIIDIMPYDSRNRAGAILTDVWSEELFNRETYLQRDICDSGPWPFPDKYFDFVLCAHTLEDIRDPVRVCRELIRVAKAGYIEVPSRLTESTKGVERPFYCGYYHHRWLCDLTEGSIEFLFKPAMLHAYRQFHFRKPWNKKMNPELEAAGFFWKGSFEFREKIIIDRERVQNELREFKRKHSQRSDLFVPKFDWWGRRV